MTDDTKALLKSAAANVVTILGYITTAAAFLPVMVVERPYLRSVGVVFIILGALRGSRSAITARNKQRQRADFLEDQRQANLRRNGS